MRTPGHAAAAILLAAMPLAALVAGNHYPLATPEVALLLGACVLAGALAGWISARSSWLAALVFGGGGAMALDLVYGRNPSGTSLALLLLACLALAALLRRHIARIVGTAAAVFIAALLVIPDSVAPERPPALAAAGATRPPATAKPPVLVHLVLDEQIGIAGLPADVPGGAELARMLTDAYVSRGFRVHPDAYSEYFDTRNSLANLLNFTSAPGDWAHLVEGRVRPYILTESAYFRDLSALGYRLYVYEPDYLDYCRVPGIDYASCLQYRSNSIASLSAAPLGTLERARFIFNSLRGRSHYLERLREKYRKLRAALPDVPLPAWEPGVNRVGPLAVLPVLAQLERDLRGARPGNAYFAHLLIPHYPYVLDEGCRVRDDIGQWLYSYDPDAVSELEPNSAATRAVRYRDYFAQIRCEQRLLGRLFDAMQEAGVWQDAIVIVHGDHGSRIVRRAPVVQNAARLTAEDLKDAFSTLFAVKRPGEAGEVVRGAKPLQVLLAETLGMAPPRGAAKVMLRTEDEKSHRPYPLPALGLHVARD